MVPNVVGLVQLATRWGVRKQAAHNVTRRPGFPVPARLSERVLVWDLAEIVAWEAAEVAAGRPLPGERPRGPTQGSG